MARVGQVVDPQPPATPINFLGATQKRASHVPLSEKDRNEACKLATRKRAAFWQKIARIAWTVFVIFTAIWYLFQYY